MDRANKTEVFCSNWFEGAEGPVKLFSGTSIFAGPSREADVKPACRKCGIVWHMTTAWQKRLPYLYATYESYQYPEFPESFPYRLETEAVIGRKDRK